MESKSYSQWLGKLADALKSWAELNDNERGRRLEFSEQVRVARINLVAKLVAGGHGNFVQLIDDSLASLFDKAISLRNACKRVGVKSWDDLSLTDKCCRKDLPKSITVSANSLRRELSICDELFAAISREIQQSESTNSDEREQSGRIDENESRSLEPAEKMLNKPMPTDRSTQTVDATRPALGTEQEIPLEYRTRTLSKAVAAQLHRQGKVKNPTSYFDYLIKGGHMTSPMGSGQKWIFDIRDFPASTHEKLR